MQRSEKITVTGANVKRDLEEGDDQFRSNC